MAARYDDAIAAVVAFRSTYQPDLSSTDEFAWAVGSRPDDPEAANAWDDAVEVVCVAAVSAAARHLEQRGLADGATGTPQRFERLLRRGTLGDALRNTDRLAHIKLRRHPPLTRGA